VPYNWNILPSEEPLTEKEVIRSPWILQDNSCKKWRPLIDNPWRLVLEVVRWAGGLPMWKYIADKLNNNKPDGSWEGLGRSGKTVAGRGLKAYALKLLLLMVMMTKQYSAIASIYHFIRY
jgi:hypothetical protein